MIRRSDDLKLCDVQEDSKVLARKDLLVDTIWGPFSGSIQSDESANGVSNQENCSDKQYHPPLFSTFWGLCTFLNSLHLTKGV
ncbi:zinc finger protein ZFPM1 isoform X1 [Tachysurus ichikawai]